MSIKYKNGEKYSNNIKNEIITSNPLDDIREFIKSNCSNLFRICRQTLKSIKFYKIKEIFSNSDLHSAQEMLNEIYEKTTMLITSETTDHGIEELQHIFDKVSIVISLFGTKRLSDIEYILYGSKFTILPSDSTSTHLLYKSKYELIQTYVRFNGYKHISTIKCILKDDIHSMDKGGEYNISIEKSNQLECYEPNTHYSSFYYSLYGLRILLQNKKDNKTVILFGTIEDIPIEWISTNDFIKSRKNDFLLKLRELPNNNDAFITRFIESLSLRDYLLYGTNDISDKYKSALNDIEYVKNTNIDSVVQKFKDMTLLKKRTMLLHLILYNSDHEIQYIAYMLYDILSINRSSMEHVDSEDQIKIYDSLPFTIKKYFKEAMKHTIHFSNDFLNKYDSNKLTLEQRIFFMKAAESIKEKAFLKLKELKGKPEEQGGKIKQYLEGLIKIPFGIYKEEPSLTCVKKVNSWFIEIVNNPLVSHEFSYIPIKTKYTIFEIFQYVQLILPFIETQIYNFLDCEISKLNKTDLSDIVFNICESENIKFNHKNSSKSLMIDFIKSQMEVIHSSNTKIDVKYIKYNILCKRLQPPLLHKYNNITLIQHKITDIKDTIKNVKSILDDSIHGHKTAKNQILKIISQWMNGENSGYCFGFEGSPGIGKTSLAKRGLAKCLLDENGTSRPFSFIAMGGSCNGSTLEGHNYTYVNSSWGRIVDILMESKCLNPIIYIDELDKVSKTEQGREIIGILTHLIDSSQNDEFQDKYFSGIPIDLSKALFIFSYNDPDQIDKILLDRIHRIKFDNLSTNDKIVIVRNFILPELNKRMGFEDVIEITDEVVEYIIDYYTVEPGIRKLKEILFDLFGEINIELLDADVSEKPATTIAKIKIQKRDLGTKYIQKYKVIQEKKINTSPTVGVINGLWANNVGKGGIIPIEVSYFPCSSFLELKLTGLQGDVMKESMNIAKTLAWNLTANSLKKPIITKLESIKTQGIHIHCPDGSTSKDGPSAGAAITLAIYSLFNHMPILQNIAITGEINLQGEITAIGGLDTKIIGGIRSGITLFLYPKDNQLDFEECEKKNKKLFETKKIKFIAVSHIKEVLQYAFTE